MTVRDLLCSASLSTVFTVYDVSNVMPVTYSNVDWGDKDIIACKDFKVEEFKVSGVNRIEIICYKE